MSFEITLGSAKKYVIPYLKQKMPVLLRGQHGIGKSEVVYQIAKEFGLPVTEQRVSQLTDGDILGMPDKNGTVVSGKSFSIEATKYKPMVWLAKACTSPHVVFLDEIGRGTREVRQATFQLTDSRRIGDYELHPDSIVIAADNGGIHGKNYGSNTMDLAELSRFQVFDVRPDFGEWKDWAKGVVHSELINFISTSIEKLFAPVFSSNQSMIHVYPNPRQWVRLDKVMRDLRYYDQKILFSDKAMAMAVIAASVGAEAASSYLRYMENKQSFGLLDCVKDPEILLNFFKKTESDIEKTEKVNEILQEILTDSTWLWSFDPTDVYTKGPKKGHIKASGFMDALYQHMKHHPELSLPYIYNMIMGTQLQILEPISNNIADSEERRLKILELQMRMKTVFASMYDENGKPIEFMEEYPDEGREAAMITAKLTPADYKNQEGMLNRHFSYDSRLCAFVRDEVSKSDAMIQDWIDKKTAESKAA